MIYISKEYIRTKKNMNSRLLFLHSPFKTGNFMSGPQRDLVESSKRYNPRKTALPAFVMAKSLILAEIHFNISRNQKYIDPRFKSLNSAFNTAHFMPWSLLGLVAQNLGHNPPITAIPNMHQYLEREKRYQSPIRIFEFRIHNWIFSHKTFMESQCRRSKVTTRRTILSHSGRDN